MRLVPDLPSLSVDERDALADIMRALTVRYDNLFRCSFPYSMGLHGRPRTAGSTRGGYTRPSSAAPALGDRQEVPGRLRALAEPQRDLTAEQAALRLREMPLRHYRHPMPSDPQGDAVP